MMIIIIANLYLLRIYHMLGGLDIFCHFFLHNYCFTILKMETWDLKSSENLLKIM